MTVIDRAVTQATGPVRFLVHASGGMGKVAGSAGREDRYESEVTVPGISLDEFVYGQGNPPPQVVKMDIEGGEVLALPGMQRVLTEARPLMLMELHGPEFSRAAWETLTAAGYEILLDAPRLPGGPCAGGAGLEGIYRGEATSTNERQVTCPGIPGNSQSSSAFSLPTGRHSSMRWLPPVTAGWASLPAWRGPKNRSPPPTC